MRIPLLSRLADGLAPRICACCGAPGSGGVDLCGPCRAALPRLGATCAHCGMPTARPVPACGRCLAAPPRFDAVIAPLQYAYPADRAIQAFKFRGDLSLGRSLASLLLAQIQQSDAPRPGLLLPVPLHAGRLRERGFNQSLEIARHLTGPLQIPLRHDLLVRTRATAAQLGLDRGARRRNVRGAFALRGKTGLADHVALIDDVLTTGATVSALARLLKEAGVSRVSVWTLARAGD